MFIGAPFITDGVKMIKCLSNCYNSGLEQKQTQKVMAEEV